MLLDVGRSRWMVSLRSTTLMSTSTVTVVLVNLDEFKTEARAGRKTGSAEIPRSVRSDQLMWVWTLGQ